MYSDYKLVRQCLLLIEEKMDWGASSSWHNDVFVELSERIQERTQVLLSPTTLKRVWGRVDYKSSPSITTLNTLAQFAGFINWRDFKGKSAVKKPSWIRRNINPNLGIIMLGASIMTLVFVSLFSLKGSKSNTEAIDVSTIGFTSQAVTTGMPNSVVFDLDIGKIKSNDVHIQQYWDPTKTIALRPGQKQATGQYYTPGYFRAKLLVDGTILKEHDLFIKTEGWLGTLDYKPVPKYIKAAEIANGKLSFPPSILEEIALSQQPLRTTFHLVNDFTKVSGDNFMLQTSIKNTFRDKWAVCQKATIIILGTKSTIMINFSIPGCVSEIGVMMSDVYISGKEQNLSGLGVDLSSTKDFKIEVRDKRLRVILEDQQLFEGSYNETLGTIVGLRYRFLGAGEVSKLRLTDLSGRTVAIDEGFKEAIID